MYAGTGEPWRMEGRSLFKAAELKPGLFAYLQVCLTGELVEMKDDFCFPSRPRSAPSPQPLMSLRRAFAQLKVFCTSDSYPWRIIANIKSTFQQAF